jgi:hypothetical protein
MPDSHPDDAGPGPSPLAAAWPPSKLNRVKKATRLSNATLVGWSNRRGCGLDRYDPVTGLNDHPEVVAFHRLVFSTPSLAGRLTQYMLEDEEALAGALGQGIGARLRAAQALAVQRVLARANWQKIADGRTARDVRPEAIADADQAYAQLR